MPNAAKPPFLIPYTIRRSFYDDPAGLGGAPGAHYRRFQWILAVVLFFDDLPPLPHILDVNLSEKTARAAVQDMRRRKPAMVMLVPALPVWSEILACPLQALPGQIQFATEYWQTEKEAGRWPPKDEEAP